MPGEAGRSRNDRHEAPFGGRSVAAQSLKDTCIVVWPASLSVHSLVVGAHVFQRGKTLTIFNNLTRGHCRDRAHRRLTLMLSASGVESLCATAYIESPVLALV